MTTGERMTTPATPPNPVSVLASFERDGSGWTREGGRCAVSSDGRLRLTLGVLASKIEYRDGDEWRTVNASFQTRARIGHLLEEWLEARLPEGMRRL